MGFFRMLFGTRKLNADPDQQTLAELFINCANDDPRAYKHLIEFIVKKPWSRSEAGNRVVHALSMVKIWRPDLYPEAKKIGENIYVNL